MNVKVAVIGAGYWGKNLIRNFHGLGALRGIFDADPENSVFREYAGVRRYGSLQDALNDQEVSAVAIATPAEHHHAAARQALLAGRHVFVEKPICLSADEGGELTRLAGDRGLTLMVGHLLQYHPAFLKLKEIAAGGGLGKIQYVYSNRLNLGKFRREENILWSFTPHDISMLLSLAGEMPERVWASGGNYLHEDIADITLCGFSFKNGIKAHIFVSWLHPYKEQKLLVVGDKAMAVFEDTARTDKLLIYPHRIDWREGNMPVPVKEDAVPVDFEPKEPLREECAHFLECVETGRRPRTDGHEGLRVLKVLSSLQASLEGGGGAVTPEARGRAFFAHETALVDEGADIGAGTKVWHFSHVMSGSKIGGNCNIGQNVVIGPNATVGRGVKIQNNVCVYEGVTLEDHVFCGPSAVFTNVFNPRSEVKRMSELRETLVKTGATIGANATIVCGNTVGRYAFIGAGAVVTSDVPDYALFVGNPARQVGWMCRCGRKLRQMEDIHVCGCGSTYRLAGGVLEEVARV